jgi:hypothetical protein
VVWIPFTCYSYSFSCYQRGKWMKALPSDLKELIQPPISASELSRRHHLHIFSQKLRRSWTNIWRKIVRINYLNNVASNLLQDNMLSSLVDDTVQNNNTGAEWANFLTRLGRSSGTTTLNVVYMNNFSSNMFGGLGNLVGSCQQGLCQRKLPAGSLPEGTLGTKCVP